MFGFTEGGVHERLPMISDVDRRVSTAPISVVGPRCNTVIARRNASTVVTPERHARMTPPTQDATVEASLVVSRGGVSTRTKSDDDATSSRSPAKRSKVKASAKFDWCAPAVMTSKLGTLTFWAIVRHIFGDSPIAE